MAHISGGGLLNLTRLQADVSYELDAMVPTPEIFALIAQRGEIPAAAMYATFNMGLGLLLVVREDEGAPAVSHLQGCGERAWTVGRIVAGARGVEIDA